MDTKRAIASVVRAGTWPREGTVCAVTGAGPLQCRACGTGYDESTWRGLGLLRRIDKDEVQRHIAGWPDGTTLEARRCGVCDGAVAARVIDAPPGPAPSTRFVGLSPAQILAVSNVLPFGAASGASGVR